MKADAPRAVRPGEELDVAKLAAFMGVPAVEVEQFPRGHPNLTYLVRAGSSIETIADVDRPGVRVAAIAVLRMSS